MIAFLMAGILATPVLTADEPKGRPALALKIDVQGNEAKLTIALNYLQDAKDEPKFEGVRFYAYTVPVADTPNRIGYTKGPGMQTVLLRGKKFVYTQAEMDRQENGSVSVVRLRSDEPTYRVTGVYHYLDQLFVIDAVLHVGEPLLLFERPGR